MNNIVSIFVVLVVLGTLLLLGQIFKTQVRAYPEYARKLVHLVMGASALSFPWLFDSVYPVLLLCIIVQCILLLLKSGKSAARDLLFGVSRVSCGELLFPLSVALIFYLSHGQPLFYTVPVAVLAFADSAAALIGGIGKCHYRTRMGHKTVEGSLAFFITATIAAALTLSACAHIDAIKVILIALLLAALATIVEGFSSAGFDNLLIPVAVSCTLKQIINLDSSALAVQLGWLTLLMIFVLLLRRITALSGNANLIIMAYGYLAVSHGGITFLLMPALMLLGFRLLLPQSVNSHRLSPSHCENAVLSMSFVGLVYLLWPNSAHNPALLFVYSLAFVTQGAITASAELAFDGQGAETLAEIFINVLKSWSLLFVPYLLLNQGTSIWLVLASLINVFVLTTLFVLAARPNPERNKLGRWVKQSAVATLGAMPFFLLV